MPNYPYDEIGTRFNREFVAGLNKNFDEIEQDLNEVVEPLQAVLDGEFDNAALATEFEARANEKLEEIQPEFYQFQQNTTAQLAQTETEFTAQLAQTETELTAQLAQTETELTAQLAEIETQELPSKANATDVRLKSTKLGQSDMTEEFIKIIAGTSPVNSIPADKAVTESKFADGVEKWLKKENLFIQSPTKWQYGNVDTAGGAPTNRITTPVADRISVSPGTQVSLFFSDTTKRLGIKQFDVNGVQLSDSGWIASGILYTLTILGNTTKIGLSGSYTNDATILTDAFTNVEAMLVQGKTIPTYEKSKFDKNKDVEKTSLDFNNRFTLQNLFPKNPIKWINGLVGGTPVSNNTTNAPSRLAMRVEYSSIDVSKTHKIYFKNLSNFDLAFVEIDENRNLLKDSGWLTIDEYNLNPKTKGLYLVLKKKSNYLIYPSEVRNIDMYFGITPYVEDSEGISSLKNSIEDRLNPLFFPSKPRFVAHRGFSSKAPENTIASFTLAGIEGFWGIESDVMATSDNKLIIMHDDNVDRTTNGTGNVRDLTFEQIQNMNIDYGTKLSEYPNEKVPTFEGYLDVCKRYGAIPIIELKSSYLTNANLDLVVSTLKKYGFEETSILISFEIKYLDYIRQTNKKIHLQPLLDLNTNNIETVKNFGNSSINSSVEGSMKELIQQAHENGLMVNVNTINDETLKNQLLDYGVDMLSTDVFSS